MRKLLIIILAIGFIGCSNSEPDQPKTLAAQVDAFIEADEYQKALQMLETEDENEEVLKLKEATYLNYGLFLEYRDSNTSNMREKMNSALEQYIEVLKINQHNEKAVSEINQILGIYSTFPDRKPDDQIAKDLKLLGFEF